MSGIFFCEIPTKPSVQLLNCGFNKHLTMIDVKRLLNKSTIYTKNARPAFNHFLVFRRFDPPADAGSILLTCPGLCLPGAGRAALPS